ncbi:MAG: response regulator [Cyanosarcina radialis HA8281-LM2]|nr:response regulator [Cyanosarcina radialis HA8281-LM2]
MKFLVVEDDEFTAQTITSILTNQNYVVEVASDGESAWDLVETFDYDLIILDLILPKLDGISLCHQIRSKGLKTPILLLSGRDSSHDKAIGLDAGADDYLVKPFDSEELVARVRALLRRGGLASQPVLAWGELKLDPSSCEATYAQKPLALTPKEYALLELFLRNSNRVFSCGTILDHLWSYEDTPGEEAVRTHIKGLRQKLKAAGKSDLIETVYGIGYRLKPLEERGRWGDGERGRGGDGEQGRKSNPKSKLRQAQLPIQNPKSQEQTLSAIAGVWHKYKGRVAEQINVLEQASQALSTNTLSEELRDAARKEAHTLAGSLGTFGFANGSQLAKEIENLLKVDRHLTPTTAIALHDLVLALRRETQGEAVDRPSLLAVDREPNTTHTEAHLLAVDDDPKILAVLETLLNPWGFKVTTLDDPRRFQETLAATSPDLLILDIEMPHVNGIELCQSVRNDPRWSDLPILFLTVHNDAEILERVFSVGADDFVSKPIVGPELVTRIINRLDRVKLLRRAAQRQLERDRVSSQSIESLRSSEERLRWALEAAGIGIWDWDLATDKIIWSEGHERLFGLAPGTFDGTYETFNNCVLPEDRAALTEAANVARQEQKEYCHEFRVVWPDGSIHWIERRGRFFYSTTGEPLRMLGTVRDISARKLAEAELKKSKNGLELRVAERTAELIKVNEQLRSELNERQRTQEALRHSQALFAGIVEIAEDAIISIDSHQRITLFNQGAEKIFGYSAAEAIGQPLDLLLPARFSAPHRQHVDEFGRSPSPARRMGERREIYGCHQDGTEFPAEATISKLNLPEETIYTVYLRDISDRKQIDRMKDEFISVVSHELRTPLTSIHGSLGMLASGLLPPDSEQAKRLLKIATDSTERLVRLINDVLDIERIESGKVKMAKETCNVASLIEEAVNVMQPLANKAGVNLVVSSLNAEIWADPDRIVQTLTNLLSNAIKFSPTGATVWLSASANKTDSVSLAGANRQEILFQVRDRGRGIPADKLESIFERFQQVDSSDSRKHEGTGLGLAICRSIVQQHGGRIWVESALDEGSTFYFTLPTVHGS